MLARMEKCAFGAERVVDSTVESMVYLRIPWSGNWTRKYNPRTASYMAILHTCSRDDEDSETSS